MSYQRHAINPRWLWPFLILCAGSSALSFVEPADNATPKALWKGAIHLGDNPEAFSDVTSAGMGMEVPYKSDFAVTQKIRVKVGDIQTLSGDGHFVEIIAHYEKDGSQEVSAEAFRLKDETGAEREFKFEFVPTSKLQREPTYYSIKIRVDTGIPFSLWDDFLVKGISLD